MPLVLLLSPQRKKCYSEYDDVIIRADKFKEKKLLLGSKLHNKPRGPAADIEKKETQSYDKEERDHMWDHGLGNIGATPQTVTGRTRKK